MEHPDVCPILLLGPSYIRTAALPLFTTMLDCGRRRFLRSARPRTPTFGDASKANRAAFRAPAVEMMSGSDIGSVIEVHSTLD